MLRYDRPSQLFAVCLAAVAGYVDALGFLQLGGFFASFMTGNSTKLAIGLVTNEADAAKAAALVATFIGGVMLGTATARLADTRGALLVLLLVTGLLVVAATLHQTSHDSLAIGAMVLAMGAENAVFQRNGDVAIGLTYMTGTLVKFGQRLTSAAFGEDPWAWLPYGMLWCGLVTGGIIGATVHIHVQLGGLWGAAGGMAALTVLAAWRPRLAGQEAAESRTPRS